MSQAYAIQVEESCRHERPVDHATVQRVPFGNQVKWQIRVYYDCEDGCHLSEVRERRPDRIVVEGGEDVPTRGGN